MKFLAIVVLISSFFADAECVKVEEKKLSEKIMSISSCDLVKILENNRQTDTGKNIWKGAYGYSAYTTIATAFKVIDTCNGTAPVSHVGAKQVYSEKAFDLDPDQRQMRQQIELSEQDAKVLLDQARIRCEQDLEKIELSIR